MMMLRAGPTRPAPYGDPMADRPVLVLVTGLPGTGKSTLAARVAPALGAPVLGWDWMMGALSPFGEIQAAIARMESLAHRELGWSLLWQTATAQLQRGMSVVLDGVARDHEVAATRAVAHRCGVDALVVLTTCADEVRHRARIEGRVRGIPGWHELTWQDVQGTMARFDPPRDVDIVVDSLEDVDLGVDRTLATLARSAAAG